MNTRHPIPFLATALSIVLLLPPRSSVAAEEPRTLPFLKVGSTYRLTGGEPLPTTVKILDAAGGAWFRVEYRVGPNSFPVPQPGVTTATMWVNFNTVAGVSEYKEPEAKKPEAK